MTFSSFLIATARASQSVAAHSACHCGPQELSSGWLGVHDLELHEVEVDRNRGLRHHANLTPKHHLSVAQLALDTVVSFFLVITTQNLKI